jgi:hypothetical protein
VSRIAAGPDAEFRLIGEVWHRFEYARRRPDEVAEVVRFHEDQPERNEKYGLTAPGDRRLIRYRDLPASGARYLARRRQCSRDELEWIAKRLKDQN